MVKYNIDWLKQKGFFEKTIPFNINEKEVLVDDKNLLAYAEVSSNDEVETIRKELSTKKVKYIWFYYPNIKKVKVYRKIGEVKWFYYSPRMRSDYLKSRIDKLNKFSPENMNILFDIKDIVNKFYWQLWEHRILMAKKVKQLKEDKNKLLVVQHLIDRLIFFYFIAQLKLVKIKNEERVWVLDRKNTREFFKWISDQLNEEELQEFLNRIFFDALGKVNETGWSTIEFDINGEKFSVISPSLNGGLFTEQKIEGIPEREIKIYGIKDLILKVLNNYNWIIGEEAPEEEDVIGDLTPEIIGHIYEKFVVSLEQIGLNKIRLEDSKSIKDILKELRKSKGVYYTPEEITNYISTNTIYPYIKDILKEQFGEKGENLFDSLSEKDNYDTQELEIIKYLYFEILTKIKICDNACGSGSFLIAAGDVLKRLYSRVLEILEKNLSTDEDVKKVLEDIKESPTKNYYIVRQIIINNLYGVDIMEGAVEIAKLRFWLWLISQVDPKKIEGKRIETLPNLDFNLMVGNSLIGFVNIEDLEFDFLGKQTTLTKFIETEKDKIKWLKKIAEQKRKYKTLPSHKAKKLKEKLNKDLEKAREYLNEEFYKMLKAKKIKITKEELLKLKPFHWGFEFYEVFDLEKSKTERGFDIIIGNPPYGNILSKIEKHIASKVFVSRNSEIAGLFVERSVFTLKRSGYFAYIITFAITFNKELSKTREILWNNFVNIYISTFDRDRCRFFDEMTQSVSIMICESKSKNTKANFWTSRMFREMPKSLYEISYSIANNFILTSNGNISPNAFDKDHRLPKLGEEINTLILKKLLKNKYKISDVLDKNGFEIWIRTSGNYWYNSWSIKPYESTEIKLLKSKREWRDFIILLMNSSLFYLWFRIYGDGRHMNIDIFKAFPLPHPRKIRKDHILIKSMRERFESELFGVFERKRNRFRTSEVKGFLDIIDLVIGKRYYGLNPSEILWILNIDFEVRGGIKIPRVFYMLIKYMDFLSKVSEMKTEETELWRSLIDFIDRQILNSLIYEFYFREKFISDGINTNLLELVQSYLEDIFKLDSDDQRLQKIKEIIENIKNDESIMDQIRMIRSHPWVKTVECS